MTRIAGGQGLEPGHAGQAFGTGAAQELQQHGFGLIVGGDLKRKCFVVPE